VPATRSVEGTTAVLAASFAAACLGYWLLGFAPEAFLGRAAAVSLAATIVESISPHGLDNFSVMAIAAAVA
jgi:dolichol kinase